MARDPGRNYLRERIAHLAARLMAVDGIEDHALAKRKAARQAGVADMRQLPNNDEIDAALESYRVLYQPEHAAQLRQLRQVALELMIELAHFNPYLTGSVLKGNAGKYAAINLLLFTDNGKSVEHYLLARAIDFRGSTSRLYAGDAPLAAPVLSFSRNGIDIHLTLLLPRELRRPLKADLEGRPLERARREAVEALLAED